MAAPVDNTATLKSLVSVANSKIEPKILTDRNFEVLSIKPLRSTTSPHNTVASVQVDLAGDSPIAIVSSDRYSRRLVEFTRIDLKDIANFRAIPKNEKGQYIGEITDVASVIDLLNAAIEEDELVLIKTADATVVKSAEDSLGYVGAITFAGASEETEEPGEAERPGETEEPTPVVLTALMIIGLTTMITDDETTFTVQFTPADAEPGTLTWSATDGVIDPATGAFITPSEAGNVTITVSSGDISTEHVVTVMGNAERSILSQNALPLMGQSGDPIHRTSQ